MINKDEFLNMFESQLALKYFNVCNGVYVDREKFLEEEYNNFQKSVLLDEAKAGDNFLEVVPALKDKQVILEKIVSITRDYVTLSVSIDGLKGSLRFITNELKKYVKEN